MSGDGERRCSTRPIRFTNPECGFRCGSHALDDYFARHALANDHGGIGRTYVYEATPQDAATDLPAVLGFYTLSMAAAASLCASNPGARLAGLDPGRIAVDHVDEGPDRRLAGA